MSSKGRKTYEKEIASLQKSNVQIYQRLEVVLADLLSLMKGNIFNAIIRLIKMRKQYKEHVKLQDNERSTNTGDVQEVSEEAQSV